MTLVYFMKNVKEKRCYSEVYMALIKNIKLLDKMHATVHLHGHENMHPVKVLYFQFTYRILF